MDDSHPDGDGALAVDNPQGAGEMCPYGQPGDRLWVKETFWHGDVRIDHRRHERKTLYRADAPPEGWSMVKRWKPSIFMPRKASRLTLEIVGVRVERVQDISHADAVAEGVAQDDAVYDFSQLWNSINAAPKPVEGDDGEISHYESYPWEDTRETRTHRGKPWLVIGNPWVWVVEFKRVESEVAA